MPYSARPPGLMSRFRMMTSWPPCAIFCAANIPAGPAPTTKTVFKRVLPRYTGTRFEQALPSPAEMSFKCEQLPLLSLTIRDHARPKFHTLRRLYPAGGRACTLALHRLGRCFFCSDCRSSGDLKAQAWVALPPGQNFTGG